MVLCWLQLLCLVDRVQWLASLGQMIKVRPKSPQDQIAALLESRQTRQSLTASSSHAEDPLLAPVSDSASPSHAEDPLVAAVRDSAFQASSVAGKRARQKSTTKDWHARQDVVCKASAKDQRMANDGQRWVLDLKYKKRHYTRWCDTHAMPRHNMPEECRAMDWWAFYQYLDERVRT